MKKRVLLPVLGGIIAVAWVLVPTLHPKSSIPSDWEVYVNPTIGFSFRHDPDLKYSERSKSDISFYAWGPTQSDGTEVYDGLIISFRKVRLTATAEEYIQSQIDQFQNVGQITEPLHDIRINKTPAKSFSASTLGDFTIIFVPLDDKNLIEISYLAPDPGQLGFQKKIDQMLFTFNLTAQ